MGKQSPPGKIGARVSELLSAPLQQAARRASPARAATSGERANAAQGRKSPAGPPPPGAVPFEFGAVAVHPAVGDAVAQPRAASVPTATITPSQGVIKSKAPGQPTPPLAPAALAPSAVVPLPAALAADAPAAAHAEAAAPPAARSAADLEGTPPAQHHPAPAVPAGAWSHIFDGLAAVAQAMRGSIAASLGAQRPHAPTLPVAAPDRGAPHARDGEKTPAAVDWSGRLFGLSVAAAELSRWSAEGRFAADRARALPEALGVLPMGPEAARIGQAARIVGATLATIRAARAAAGASPAPRAQAFAERMLLRWSALDQLLVNVRAGDAGLGPAIDAAAAAALTDAQNFFEASAAAGRGLEAAGAKPLFVAAGQVGRALDEAGRQLSRPEAKEASAAPIESLLQQAAAGVTGKEEALAEAAAPPVNATAHALRNEEKDPAAPDRKESAISEKKERPAAWELHVERTTAEVAVQDIARALGVARPGDVREVLLQGLSTRHQFVLWTRVGIKLSTPLQALVNDGLVETRIKPR